MSQAKTVVEYEVDYEGARAKAEEIGRSIHRKYPEISYRVYVKTDEGAYLVLYGRDEERIRRSMARILALFHRRAHERMPAFLSQCHTSPGGTFWCNH